jgi:hypothetical protein
MRFDMSRMSIGLALLAALGAACAGSSGPAVPQDATLVLDLEPPDGGTINFPSAFVGTEQTETIQVMNQGRKTLTVSSVALAGADGGAIQYLDGGGVFSAPEFSDAMPAGITGLDAGFIRFTYKPTKPGRSSAVLLIESDAPARPHVAAPISACAVAVDAGADAGC